MSFGNKNAHQEGWLRLLPLSPSQVQWHIFLFTGMACNVSGWAGGSKIQAGSPAFLRFLPSRIGLGIGEGWRRLSRRLGVGVGVSLFIFWSQAHPMAKQVMVIHHPYFFFTGKQWGTSRDRSAGVHNSPGNSNTFIPGEKGSQPPSHAECPGVFRGERESNLWWKVGRARCAGGHEARSVQLGSTVVVV